MLCGLSHLCSSPFAPFLGVCIKLSLPSECWLVIYPYGFTLTGLWTNWGQENCFIISVSSVAQSCLTLCDPMDCSTSGLPVHHQFPEFTQTHVHWVGDAIQPSHPLSSHLQSIPASGSFPMSQFFTSGSQGIGVSASASVLPMNTQDWFPLKINLLIFVNHFP